MKMTDSQTMILVHARAADTLTALTGRLSAPHETVLCPSVYDLFTALSKRPQQPAVLITRPAMFAGPHLAEALRPFPRLRIIVYLASGEPAPPLSGLSITPVADADELAAALETVAGTTAPQAEKAPPAALPRLDPADYRLSDAERNALLGAGS